MNLDLVIHILDDGSRYMLLEDFEKLVRAMMDGDLFEIDGKRACRVENVSVSRGGDVLYEV